jgi:hypothetical protein
LAESRCHHPHANDPELTLDPAGGDDYARWQTGKRRDRSMVANLYRGRDYCQIWTRQLVVVTHRGVVGQRGVVTEQVVASTEAEEKAFQDAVRDAESEGYVPLEKIPNSQILVNYKVSAWEESEIQSFKNTLQGLLGDLLGWTGNGCCDGFTLGREGLTL